jgi:hypothetical protein
LPTFSTRPKRLLANVDGVLAHTVHAGESHAREEGDARLCRRDLVGPAPLDQPLELSEESATAIE